MPNLSQFLKKELNYDFKLGKIQLNNEILKLLGYLKELYDEKNSKPKVNWNMKNAFAYEYTHTLPHERLRSESPCKRKNNISLIEFNRGHINSLNFSSISDYDMFNVDDYDISIIKLLGTPLLIHQTKLFSYYKFIKPTPPILDFNSNSGKYYPKHFNYSLNYKTKNYNNPNIFTSLEEIEKKEEKFKKIKLVENVLYRLNLLTDYQMRCNYFVTNLLPQCNDGQFIAHLINIFERKKVIRGISKDTFYKKNIHYNFIKIFDFLNTKVFFKSNFLYVNNFYNNIDDLFNFLYEIVEFYTRKNNHYYNEERKISDSLLSDFSNDFFHLDKTKSHNSSFNSMLFFFNKNIGPKGNSAKDKKLKNKIEVTQPINNQMEEILELREGIKGFSYQHFIPNKNSNVLSDSELFDLKVKDISAWLRSIGINKKINFYCNTMEDFKDGLLLYKIVVLLESNHSIIPKIDLNPKTTDSKINNIKIILNMLSHNKKLFPIKFLNKQKEIYAAFPNTILELLISLREIYNKNNLVIE